MSPSYLHFQTLLPLFWTLFSAELPWCYFCAEIKFSEWLETPGRIFLELIKNTGESVWGAPLTSTHGPPGAPLTSTPTLHIHIRGEKNKREGFIKFYDMEPPPSPNLSREGWSGVRSGLRRGGFVAIVIINHPPSPISWWSPPCMSHSIVGLLDGDGLDEIYHVIKFVLLGFDP